MPFFWKKHESIESMLLRYFDECDEFFACFENTIREWLGAGCSERFSLQVEQAHRHESAADDLRREIELTLYGKSMLPESRDDLLELLELYDLIPTAGEQLLFDINSKGLCMPEQFRKPFAELMEQNLRAYYLVRKTVDALMNNPRATLAAVKEVDAAESCADRLERELVRQIYQSELEGWQKIELKALVNQLAKISDLAEHTSDRVGIVAIKRNI